jgi:hypothetical protein
VQASAGMRRGGAPRASTPCRRGDGTRETGQHRRALASGISPPGYGGRLGIPPDAEPPWSTRYPELLKLYDDEPALAKGNRIVRNICMGGRWLDLLDKLTDKIVYVKDNLVNEDPHFVDAGHQNFQLRDDSPAYKLGFKRIPVQQIGLLKDEPRAR